MPAPQPEAGHFAEFLGRVGKELDETLAGEPTDALSHQSRWASLERPLPQRGVGAKVVLDELSEYLIPFGNNLSYPSFLGWITSGPSTTPTAAATAAMVAAPQRYGRHAFNLVEEQSLEWLRELCGLAPDMNGVYSTGGSVANLLALGGARQRAFEKQGLDPAADGLDGRKVAVYASTEVHHTVNRAAAVLGMGRGAVRLIATDDRQRMDPNALRTGIAADVADGVLPIAVVASAGTTNTGAIDPLRALGEIAHNHGAWFHVDGAYGLPGILDPRLADRFDGLELADSAIVDPHKWLGAPVGIAATFVRDRGFLFRAFTQEPAEYLEGSFVDDSDAQSTFDSMGIPYSEFGIELSAPSRGVMVWAILRELGVEGMRHRIVTDNDYARRVAAKAQADPRLENLTEPELSIACFRYVAEGVDDLDQFNKDVVIELRRRTPWIASATVVNGMYAIRPCFINVRTRDEHVGEFVDAVIEVADDLAAGR